MPRLTQEQAHDVIAYNINALYHISAKYKNINYYFKKSDNVKKTLLQLYHFMQDKQIILNKHRYEFAIDNGRMTGQVRKKPYTDVSTFRYVSLLCAMGFLTKIPQDKADPDNLLQVNRNYFHTHPDRQREITVYTFRRYDTKELNRIETRSERLRIAGVGIGNITFNMLMLNNCQDIAREVFRKNSLSAPERKQEEYEYLVLCLDMLIESKGYAMKQELIDNLAGFGLSDQEIETLFRVIRNNLLQKYYYKRPTKQQKALYGLTEDKFIFTTKEDTKEDGSNQ